MYGDDQFGGGDFGGGGFGAAQDNQFGGAGFGGSQFGQASQGGGAEGGFAVDNSAPDGKAKARNNQQSLIPATIKQLQSADTLASGEQGFTIAGGKELQQVTIVGIIVSADEQNTNLQYTVDDGTGVIVAKMWVDADADEAMAERRAEWKEGKMVRVVGQLRTFNQTRSIVAFDIQPIKDFNEYTFHFIEVVHTHLHLTKGRPPAGATGAPGVPMATGAATGFGQAAPQQQQPQNNANHLNETVLNFFKSYGETEMGTTIDQCFDALRSNGVTLQQVRDIVDRLTNEGHLYSTVDDNHFKGT